MIGNPFRLDKIPNPPPSNDRARTKRLFDEGYALRGNIQDTVYGRSAESLNRQITSMLIGTDEQLTFNEEAGVWMVPARIYEWLRVRGHDLRLYRVEGDGFRRRYDEEFRKALAKPATNIPKEPEVHPWDVRKVDLD